MTRAYASGARVTAAGALLVPQIGLRYASAARALSMSSVAITSWVSPNVA